MKKILAITISAIALTASASQVHLRTNQAGYLTDDIKCAVYMGDIPASELSFTILSPLAGDQTAHIDSVVTAQPWAPFPNAARIYFSSLESPGEYVLGIAKDGKTLEVNKIYIGDDAYSRLRLHELPLTYLRQQRCGYNPVHHALCHQDDGFVVLSDSLDGQYFDVKGGWHDASDYLQYLTTSANTVYNLLYAYANTDPAIWEDEHDSRGEKGPNGIPDILDEARWGLEWMQKMNPRPGIYFNQIADDRDHRYVGVPQNDNSDYGRGPGNGRPVYPCSAKPYGLFKHKNRSTGLASSLGKFASSFALGAQIFAQTDTAFAADLLQRAIRAYADGRANPGACQTAPCVSPYFYEEDDWADDMELGATALLKVLPAADSLRAQAREYARLQPVKPWMGADSARHYQWYPFVNLAHHDLAADTLNPHSSEALRHIRMGLDAVSDKALGNAYHIGLPWIWCSNNLATAFITQAMRYRQQTGDNKYREAETATRDWLFGTNPWGQTMIIMPQGTIETSPQDPHSAMTDITVGGVPGREHLVGGIVDGPVSTAIFNSLWGVHLRRPDPFAQVQGGSVTYHDDFSDYSTNEPTMDGTAAMLYFLGQLSMKK